MTNAVVFVGLVKTAEGWRNVAAGDDARAVVQWTRKVGMEHECEAACLQTWQAGHLICAVQVDPEGVFGMAGQFDALVDGAG